VTERGDDVMIDRSEFDPETGRVETTGWCTATGCGAEHAFHPPPTIPEWRQWLGEAGFEAARFTDSGGNAAHGRQLAAVVTALA